MAGFAPAYCSCWENELTKLGVPCSATRAPVKTWGAGTLSGSTTFLRPGCCHACVTHAKQATQSRGAEGWGFRV